MPPVLRFGIHSLDRLIGTIGSPGHEMHGIDLSKPANPERGSQVEENLSGGSSICLAGPDGTGKSVLSLHLASQYLADCLRESTAGKPRSPKVLYISTDLTYSMALKGWNHFALDIPFKRKEPLVELKEGRPRPQELQVEVRLQPYFPSGDENSPPSVVSYLEDCSPTSDGRVIKGEVCFVDLSSSTAGDDWGFVHRLLASLETPDRKDPRHLVLLDAVEGFETLVGDLNAFGEKSSRRSRIAQVMRLVSGKCHVLLVVEESHEQRFPEEFVTDVVVRLRNVETGRYLRRTVEIEKARGQWHRRGQHPYVIRDGSGSTTGSQTNADDPKVFRDGNAGPRQSYVHVFPSLDFHSREIMISQRPPPKTPDPADSDSTDGAKKPVLDNEVSPTTSHRSRFAAFGLPYLDNMLGGRGEKAELDSTRDYDTRGLVCGSSTALIGDALTQKTQLANAFLSRTFYSFAEELRKRMNEKTEGDFGSELGEEIKAAIRGADHETTLRQAWGKVKLEAEQLAKELDGTPIEVNADGSITGRPHPVAVLFTTQDINVDKLADELYQWLREDENTPGGETDTETELMRRLSEDEFLQKLGDLVESFAEEYGGGRPIGRTPVAKSEYRIGKNRFISYLIDRAFEHELKKHIARHTICRRLEIHDLPAPVLLNIFQRSIEQAQRILFRREGNEARHIALPDAPTRAHDSWRIRVVIDDLNAFRSTYPEMRDDPLMLPSLLFMLGREGVTSLILDTQASSSPQLPVAERFDTSVRELVQTRIYVWRLPFFGESRVAISVIPPISHEYRGLIRELRGVTPDKRTTDRALTVDPHFELYLDIEKSLPQPVPVEIRLYADTSSVERYIGAEEKLLKEVFTPISKNADDRRVIAPIPLKDYEALRDACNLQREMRLNHTMLLQVNEFWWLKPPGQRRAGAFRPQWNYLNATTTTSRQDKYSKRHRYCSESAVDPFQVFQPASGQRETNKTSEFSVKRRRDFFDDACGYGLRNFDKRDEQYIDRVPYTWDFGFLLCNAKAWNEVLETQEGPQERAPNKATNKVKEVWNKLCKAAASNGGSVGRAPSGAVSWKEFFEASKIVAEFQSFRTSSPSIPFDLTMAIPESFSCLILEMWLSESYDAIRNYQNTPDVDTSGLERIRKRLRDVGSRHWYPDLQNPVTLLHGLEADQGKTMADILDFRMKREFVSQSNPKMGFSLELYKVWLLLTEVLNFPDLIDSASYMNFEFKSRDVTPRAVCARHWYKSASKYFDSLTPEQVEYNWVPVRLPGHFSVRADWFLAVAGGSRSSRLADNALDLLSSKRSNIARLQEGVGLPTRELFEGDRNTSHLRTRLISAPKGQPLENIEYDFLRKIGANPNEEFYWLWRSRIWAYNRHSRIWQKWLNRALLWWHSWRQRYESDWKSGFAVYTLLDRIEFPRNLDDRSEALEEFAELNLNSWHRFHELRDILVAELQQVSIAVV